MRPPILGRVPYVQNSLWLVEVGQICMSAWPPLQNVVVKYLFKFAQSIGSEKLLGFKKSAGKKILSSRRGAKNLSDMSQILFRIFRIFSNPFSYRIQKISGTISFCRKVILTFSGTETGTATAPSSLTVQTYRELEIAKPRVWKAEIPGFHRLPLPQKTPQAPKNPSPPCMGICRTA